LINFQDELKSFKPSLEIDDIESVIEKSDIADIHDIVMKAVSDSIDSAKKRGAARKPKTEDDGSVEI
jgi:hypothetical protein